MKQALRPEVLWCANRRGNGWSFPREVDRLLREMVGARSCLHLFGGLARWGTRLDIDPITSPDVMGDAWLPPFDTGTFDVVILDPPYIRLNAQMKNALFQNAAAIAREQVVWFSTTWMASGARMRPERAWLVRVGDNCLVRCLQVWRVSAAAEKVWPRRFARGPARKYNRWLAQPAGLPFGAEASA
jgi:hypothetical protein